METKGIFDRTIDLAEKALNMRSRRHELLLSNIANADTPNYKAFDMLVEEALAKEAPQKNGQVQLTRTDGAHLPAGGPTEQALRPQAVHLSPQVTLRGDGNTVDMDREMSALGSNQLHYRASTQILTKKFQRLRSVIQGGKG
ncbi:MAG: flagellar basal body rod protein FlgB [Desulfatitalea sp.]|nr:flagellar basal body rod protein FlgB [Desulfatitalea sp.]